MPSVFISRNLDASSPFCQLGENWQLTATSLLVFTPIVIGKLPVADWYFFYSGKGAQFFLELSTPPLGVRLACLGEGAARILRQQGYTPDFIGDGNPAHTAKEWLKLARGSRVVFVQARQSRASVQKILGDAVQADALAVYDNEMRTTFDVPATDYLIFTSPLNFEAYIRGKVIQPGQRIIGIGSTTAVTFSTASVKEYRIANTPSEAGLVECLLEWEKTEPIESVQ